MENRSYRLRQFIRASGWLMSLLIWTGCGAGFPQPYPYETEDRLRGPNINVPPAELADAQRFAAIATESAIYEQLGNEFHWRLTFKNRVLTRKVDGRFRPVDRIVMYHSAHVVTAFPEPGVSVSDTQSVTQLTFFLYHQKVVDYAIQYVVFDADRKARLHENSTDGFTKVGEFWPGALCDRKFYDISVRGKDPERTHKRLKCPWDEPDFENTLKRDGFFEYGPDNP